MSKDKKTIEDLEETIYKADELKPLLSKSISEYTDDYYNTLYSGEREFLGIDTGFTKLNKQISGLRGLVILAGAPKTGKTSYILQIATQTAFNNVPVLFYSIEMIRQQVITRILSRLSGIPYLDILLKAKPYLTMQPQELERTNFNQLFNAEQKESLEKAEAKRLELKNFYLRTLEDNEVFNFDLVKKEIKGIKKIHNAKDVLVIIDHLQIFNIEGYDNQIDKENKLITGFNEVQKSTGATIVLISQTNKEAHKDTSSTKTTGTVLAGVKGSVDLVYLASLILTLGEDTDTEKDNYSDNIKHLKLNIISRDTAGGEGINLRFDMPILKFEEV